MSDDGTGAGAMGATKTETTFALRYEVRARIAAPVERVWARLTDAKAFPAWNSTVTSIEGDIALGSRLTIRVPVSERAFTPTVARFEAPRVMVWRDGFAPMFVGERTFTLAPEADGATTFTMTESFRGVMLPLIKGSLPDFVPIFEAYAKDLARACEG